MHTKDVWTLANKGWHDKKDLAQWVSLAFKKTLTLTTFERVLK
jgi:hypothetical protein